MLKSKKLIFSVALVFVLIFIPCFYFMFVFLCPYAYYANLSNETGEVIKVSSTDEGELFINAGTMVEFVIKPGQGRKVPHYRGDLVVADSKGKTFKYLNVDLDRLPHPYMVVKGYTLKIGRGGPVELPRTVNFFLDSNKELYVLTPGAKAPDKGNQPEGYPKKGM